MNRCEADRERRQRALNDSALTERVGNLERRIMFEVGYDHRAFPEDCGGGGHGQHGMTMRFVLIGPHGAVQWVCTMSNWVPGNVYYGGMQRIGTASLVPASNHIDDGKTTDLGYHSPHQHYDGQPAYKCDYLPAGECYYDGSGLNAEPLLEAFLAHGPHAVWAALARYYSDVLATVEVES